MSQLILYSSPNFGGSEVSIYFPEFDVNFQFPEPGNAERYELDSILPNLTEFNVQIRHPRGNPGFRLSGFSRNDWLVLGQIENELFLASIFPGDVTKVVECIVRCSDGTSGSPCVYCREGAVTVRVCC